MINASEVMEGLTILARWLEDNINCESEFCFDDPEIGTDFEKNPALRGSRAITDGRYVTQRRAGTRQ
ncbi:hypothetical protein FHU09_5316 [Serratia fonticola]|nr:hypothetical protein [Serratia fonticola]TQI77318.1 hypothetical protein FHU09_5316 [Serratia fonticola]